MSDAQFLEETLTLAYDENARSKLVDDGILPRLVQYLSDELYSLNSLEVLFLLSLCTGNQKKMALTNGLVPTIKKLMVRGRLKQKKVAMATFKNLQPFIEDESRTLGEITNTADLEPEGLASILKPSQHPGRGLVARRNTPYPSASSFSLFVENMNNDGTQKAIESCLLQTPGVISFLCDTSEERVIVRTTSSREELIASIFKTTHLRSSLVKGQFNDFKPGGYVDNAMDEGWGSYLWQIINVGTPGAKHQFQQKEGDKQTWFGSWW